MFGELKATLLLLAFACFLGFSGSTASHNPCCSYPCENLGVCSWKHTDHYECDCTNTGHYGTNCQTPYLSTRIKNWIKPSKDTVFHLTINYPWFWAIFNNIPALRKWFMKTVLKMRIGVVPDPSPYRGKGYYPTWEAYRNTTEYVRTLPPVPEGCPTPMGVKGPKVLPDARTLVEKFFSRKKFEPCQERTSVMFPYFAQHFTHQFFKTDWVKGMPAQWGDHGVDMSQVYGHDLERQHELRSHEGGKLKYSVINGEVWPPLVSQANVSMCASDRIDPKYRFALGHPTFGMLPPLLVFSTIWLREHNRVCDILQEENPLWDDERIFQTARLILIGETIKIVIEDYVQHLSGFSFKLLYDPTLMHEEHISYMNQIHIEFDMLYHWHALVPDHIEVGDKAYKLRNLLFNPKPFVEGGLSKVVESSSHQFAGKVQAGQGDGTLQVAIETLKDSRAVRLQPFNHYRKKLGLKPYTSFEDFTDDKELAAGLKEMYGDIDALEMYVGFMLEKKRQKQLFGSTLTELGAPYSLKGLLANPIGSPPWWKPSTFGGEKAFNIIKTTTLKDLVCRNLIGCPIGAFKVPAGTEHHFDPRDSPKDNTSKILVALQFTAQTSENPDHGYEGKYGAEKKAVKNAEIKTEL